MAATLEGPTVRLVPLRPADAERLLGWYNDPEIVAPYDRFVADTVDGLAEAIRAAPDDPGSLAPRFGIVRRAHGELVGAVGHYRPHPVLETIEVWYILGAPEARGHGLGSEAVGLLIDELFGTEAVDRVGATCDVENVPSIRLLEKLGLRREGTLRRALHHHGRWHDVHAYGVTRAEWAARRSGSTG